MNESEILTAFFAKVRVKIAFYNKYPGPITKDKARRVNEYIYKVHKVRGLVCELDDYIKKYDPNVIHFDISCPAIAMNISDFADIIVWQTRLLERADDDILDHVEKSLMDLNIYGTVFGVPIVVSELIPSSIILSYQK